VTHGETEEADSGAVLQLEARPGHHEGKEIYRKGDRHTDNEVRPAVEARADAGDQMMKKKWIWIAAAVVVFLGIGAVKSSQDKKAAEQSRAVIAETVETVAPTAAPEPTPDLVAIEAAPAATEEPVTRSAEKTYILNTNTGKFHKPSCSSVKDMKDYNKQEFTGTRDDVIAMGYEPCGKCHP